MIYKYWNVRLATSDSIPTDAERQTGIDNAANGDVSTEVRETVRLEEDRVEQKVNWIWKSLSTFEEKSANRISDMLLHVSNAAYMEGILAAKRFIVHIDLLFSVTADLDNRLRTISSKGTYPIISSFPTGLVRFRSSRTVGE
jgi:hypothetical protein